MLFIIRVKQKGESDVNSWDERYDKYNIITLEDAEVFGREIVDYFNGTLRPHEQEREFVLAEIIGEGEDSEFDNEEDVEEE